MTKWLGTIAALFAIALVGGCSGSNGSSGKTKPDYEALQKDLAGFYPNAGWTLDLTKQAADSICQDLGSHSYEDVVQDRTKVLKGDRAQAQEAVIGSVRYVYPDKSGKVPGLK